MPCHSAIVKKKVTSLPDTSVEDVLKEIKKGKVSASAIIDEEGNFLGLFSMRVLLKDLMPVSVAVTGDVTIDLKVNAAPGVAKRLKNVKTLPVSDLMCRNPSKILPDAPIWEGVSMLTNDGEPLCVIDHSGKFCGLITYDSLVDNLENIESTDS